MYAKGGGNYEDTNTNFERKLLYALTLFNMLLTLTQILPQNIKSILQRLLMLLLFEGTFVLLGR